MNQSVVEIEGRFFKTSIGKEGQEIRREVQLCGCGSYISKKCMRTHKRSKKHQDFVKSQFQPLLYLSKYLDVLKAMKKLEEDREQIMECLESDSVQEQLDTLEIPFILKDELPTIVPSDLELLVSNIIKKIQESETSSEEQETTPPTPKKKSKPRKKKEIPPPPIEDIGEENVITEGVVVLEEDKTIQEVEDTMILPIPETGGVVEEKQNPPDFSQPITELVSEIDEPKNVVVSPSVVENKEEQQSLLVSTFSDDPPAEEKVNNIPSPEVLLPSIIKEFKRFDPSPTQYFFFPHPDECLASENVHVFARSANFSNYPSEKEYLKFKGLDISLDHQKIDEDEPNKAWWMISYRWDYVRSPSYIAEVCFDERSKRFFAYELYLRQFPLVCSVATTRDTNMKGKTPYQRLVAKDRLEMSPSSSYFYYYDESKNKAYRKEYVFPISFPPQYRHGYCHDCKEWVGSECHLPCRHSMCKSCYQRKKKNSNCFPWCSVCGINFKDRWIIWLKEGESKDKEGNIINKRGKIVKKYWEIERE